MLYDGRTESAYSAAGAYSPSEASARVVGLGLPVDNTRRGILYCHSAGFTALQGVTLGTPDFVNAAQHLQALVGLGGFIGFTGDNGGTLGWGSDAVMTALTGLYGYAIGTGGAKTGKVGILGHSMGALNALNWIKRNPTLVACAMLTSPCTDLDYCQLNQSGVDAAYSNNYAVNSVGHNPIVDAATVGALGIPILLVHGDADSVMPLSHSQAYIAAANVGGNNNVSLLTIPGADHFTAPGISKSVSLNFFKQNMPA